MSLSQKRKLYDSYQHTPLHANQVLNLLIFYFQPVNSFANDAIKYLYMIKVVETGQPRSKLFTAQDANKYLGHANLQVIGNLNLILHSLEQKYFLLNYNPCTDYSILFTHLLFHYFFTTFFVIIVFHFIINYYILHWYNNYRAPFKMVIGSVCRLHALICPKDTLSADLNHCVSTQDANSLEVPTLSFIHK